MPVTRSSRTDRKSILWNICIILLAIGICVLLVCYSHTRSGIPSDSVTEEIIPYSIIRLQDGSKEYKFDVHKRTDTADRLRFYTAHQFIEAYNSNGIIYEYNRDGGIWFSSPGSAYHFVPITEDDTVVIVHVTPAYKCVSNQTLQFYTGECESMIEELMRNSLSKFVASILMLITATGLFVYYCFMFRRIVNGREMLYLSIFSFIMGIWSFNETDVSALIMTNKIFDCVIPYICILSMVAPFVMFIYEYLGLADKIVYKIILWINIIEFVVLSILHFTKIYEYRESLFLMQINLVIAAMYLFFAVVIKIAKRQYTRRLQICVIGLGLFAFAMIVDLIDYYRSLGDADSFGRYVYLTFIFLLTWDMIKGTNEIILKGRRAKELEAFAITDSMTGVFNRNAYEKYIASIKSLDGLRVIVADLNNLKYTNDTFGHDAGDAFIIEVADVINDICGARSNCYRTGGDEFVVFLENYSDGAAERVVRGIRTRVAALNMKPYYSFKFEVAIGVATYDPVLDKDIASLLKRADQSMYADKKRQKESAAQSVLGLIR